MRCVCADVEDTPQDLALSKMKEIIGQSRNYGASPEEKAVAERRQQEAEVQCNDCILHTYMCMHVHACRRVLH